MTPPTVYEDAGDLLVVRTRAGRSEDRLEIRLLEVLSDVEHEMGEARPSRRTASSATCRRRSPRRPVDRRGLRLDRREWPTDIGPVDLMCRDEAGAWVAVEIKRIGTIDAVEQLKRYLERIRLDTARADARASSPRSIQAPGADAGRGARHPLRRGRPRRAAGRDRARTDPVRGLSGSHGRGPRYTSRLAGL